MAQKINPLLNRHSAFALLLWIGTAFLSGCSTSVVDSNQEIEERKWAYRNHLVTRFEIKDYTKPYNVYFKLRHTDAYRYANIFILAHFKEGKKVQTKRYQFTLAENNGEWLGSGSGNLFTYTLPMLRNYRFPKNGTYEIEIEQNMRDNPLTEISDIGLLIKETPAF